MILLIDLETYAEADLRKVGAYRYTEDPSFRVLMAGWTAVERLEDLRGMTLEQVQIATDEVTIWEVPGLFDPAVIKVAHNAQFERLALSRFMGLPQGEYMPPGQFVDTQALGALRGLPQKLELMARALGVDPKDEAGTALINFFSKPNRRGERNLPEDHPEKWEEFCRYCRQDVATTGQILDVLGLDFPTQTERAVWDADQRINDAGIAADLELVSRAIEADNRNRTEAERQLTDLLKIENPRSVQQFTDGLSRLGLEVPNLRAATVEALLAGELTADQRRALELRAEIAGSAVKKYQAIEDRVSPDGRYRGCFRYFGAHTGRWTGSGVQLQNLPRATIHAPAVTAVDLALEDGVSMTEAEARADAAEVAGVIKSLHETGRSTPFQLKALIRPTFTGPLVVVDFAAIEARVLAWLAGETWALEAFRAGRDIYVETAQRMGGLTRDQGKVAVLASGYQGGIGSLRVMGAKGTDDELDRLKNQWRRANPNIVQFWHDLEDAFGGGGRAGRVRVEKKGPDRWVWLPSGRAVVYRRVRWERWHFQDEDGRKRSKEGWRFDSPQNGGMRTDTYGGRLTENATQAVARDLLAAALVRLDRAGFTVVGHVHDEVMVEAARGSVDEIVRLMCEPPEWADGLPLAAEGFWTERYRKG